MDCLLRATRDPSTAIIAYRTGRWHGGCCAAESDRCRYPYDDRYYFGVRAVAAGPVVPQGHVEYFGRLDRLSGLTAGTGRHWYRAGIFCRSEERRVGKDCSVA